MNSSQTQQNRLKILKLFKMEATSFLDGLIEQFDQDATLVVAKIYLETQLPIEELMQSFMDKILPFKSMVQDRNEKFFLEHDVSFFGGANQSQVSHFKNLWIELDPDAKLAVWQWFDLFIDLAQRYSDIMDQMNNEK